MHFQVVSEPLLLFQFVGTKSYKETKDVMMAIPILEMDVQVHAILSQDSTAL